MPNIPGPRYSRVCRYPKVIWRHVLRNALLPTISVIATQTVYLIGGLVVIEILFQYQGIGSLILHRRPQEGFPDAAGGRDGRRRPVCGSDLACRPALCSPQSTHPLRGFGMSDAAAESSFKYDLRHDLLATVPVGDVRHRAPHRGILGGLRIFGPSLVPYDPYADDLLNSLAPPAAEHWFGTDQLGRDVFSRVIAGARDILTVAPLATVLSTMLGTALGLTVGYFGGAVDEVLSRLVDAVLALPTVIVALLALTALGTSNLHRDVRHRLHVRADHRAHCAGQRTRRARARLCGGSRTPTGEIASTSCSSKSCPMSLAPIWWRARCGSAMQSSPSRR